MKLELENIDDPRTHTFEEDDQILVLLKSLDVHKRKIFRSLLVTC